MSFTKQRLCLMIVTLLFVSSSLFAGITGKINGTVIDKETKEALPGANILIKGTTMGAAADIDGKFFIMNIPAGTYTVVASMMGYSSMEITSVHVSIDLTTNLEFSLSSEVLDMGQVVSVVAERPLIQKDVTGSTQITSSEQLQALPVSTVNDAISTAAGTQGDGNNLHMRGGRAGEVTYMVDGLNITEPQTRVIGVTVGRAAVSELQMISGGFNAEYGDAQSGVVLLTTQEGNKNKYSGTLFYQTDHFGDNGLGESVQRFDWYEATLSGPEPLTTYLLPMIGVKLPGTITFFLQGEDRMVDGIGYHEDALAESGESPFMGTSNSLRNETVLGSLFGIGDNREQVFSNYNTKLAWQISPNKKLTFGYRGNVGNSNTWNFKMNLDVEDAVRQAHEMGISDLADNDGDGRIDEETFNSRDDDGDGVIDEDAVLDYRPVNGINTVYDFAWYIDNDGDGRVDEEAYNGVDDDGDGRIDEDMQPYSWNGYDRFRRAENNNSQAVLTWSHTLSPTTFYEVRIGRLYSTFGTIPKIGKDGHSLASFDEAEEWIDDYWEAQAIIDAARLEAETNPDVVIPEIYDLLEPYRGFGYPSELYVDANNNNRYDNGETFTDLDGDGLWDFNFGTSNVTWQFQGENHPYRGLFYNGAIWSTFGGGRSGIYRRTSDTYFMKVDLTSQITKNHQIKSGLEYNYYDVKNLYLQILGPYDGRGSFPNNFHSYCNWQAAYIQDKMEFKSAIVNLGLRVERFDAGEQVATQDTSVGVARYNVPNIKWSILPRVGLSFPVTDKDLFFFNYGRFFQRPQLQNLYTQVNQVFGSSNSIIGNPDLLPEETIQYEMGLRHQFGLNTLVTITGFFKDINNLQQILKVFDSAGNAFYQYINDNDDNSQIVKGFGTVKGFEVQLKQRAGKYLTGEASYTFQVAKATHSQAYRTYGNENIFDVQPGTEYAADWDQRHKFVFHVDYHYGEKNGPRIGNIFPLENWNLSMLTEIGSGFPYTPEAYNSTPIYELTNTIRLPWTYEVDLRMRKFFEIPGGFRVGAVFEILNLLNYRNVVSWDEDNATGSLA